MRQGEFMKRVIILSVFVFGMILVSAGSIAAQSSTVAGGWDATMNTPGGPRPFGLTLKVDGEKLTGTVTRSNGEMPLVGTVKGNDISFSYIISYNDHDLELSFTGKVSGDSIAGNVSFGGNGDSDWGAKRKSAAAPKP